MSTSYVAGRWTAIVVGPGAALLHPDVPVATVRSLWEQMSAGRPAAAWLEALAGRGLASLPSFGFAETTPDGVRVLVRGEVEIEVAGEVLGATGISTWREQVVAAPGDVRLRVAGSAVGEEWPLVAGVVRADAVTFTPGEPAGVLGERGTVGLVDDGGDLTGAPEVAELLDEAEAPEVLDESDAPEAPEVLDEPDAPEVPELEEPDEAEATEVLDQPDAPASLDGPEGAAADESEAATAVAEPPVVPGTPGEGLPPTAVPAVVEVVASPEDGTDQQEVLEEVEQAAHAGAVAAARAPGGEPAEDDEPAGDDEQAGDDEHGAPAAEPADRHGTDEQLGAISSGVIDSLPWNVPSVRAQEGRVNVTPTPVPVFDPPAPTTDPDVEIEGDHDGNTILVSHLRSAYAQDAASSEGYASDATIVPGMADNALYDEPDPEPVVVLAVSTGQRVPLDRTVLVGRAPESARFEGARPPRLVTVPSPQQDISRTHVEVRLEGGHVVVTDLRSTNGTVVGIPDMEPRRLHPGEGVPVPVGTVIDLGDGVTIVLELTSHPGEGSA